MALILILAFSVSWVWTALGLALRSAQAVTVISFAVQLPLTFASNVFVSPATLPGWVPLTFAALTAVFGPLTWRPAVPRRPGGANDLDRVDNRIAQVGPQGVEDAAAGDEAQFRVGGRTVHGERGEMILGVRSHFRNAQKRQRPVCPLHVHAVTRAQLR